MRRAAVYTRISRDKTGEGLGVERQRADCARLAATLGAEVMAVFSDNDMSASTGRRRPGYEALLELVRAGEVEVVIAWHYDRLHRRPVELERYIDTCQPHAVATHFVRAGPMDLTTASGRLMARQHGLIARYEAEHLAERVARHHQQAAEEGRWAGGRRPFGYLADGTTINEGEAEVLRWMARQVLAGRSARALAHELDGRGERTAAGSRWQPTEVRRVLLRARNAGLRAHHGEVVGPAAWPAILDEPTWRAVVALLSDSQRRTNEGGQPRWLLSASSARCGMCGSRLVATASGRARKSGRLNPVYTCASGKHVARVAALLDEYVTELVVARLERPDAAMLLAPPAGDGTARWAERAAVARARLDGLAVEFSQGTIDARQLAAGSAPLRRELEAAERAQTLHAASSVLAPLIDADDVRGVFQRLDLERRRAVVSELLVVVLHPARRRGRPPGWRKGEPYFSPTDGVEVIWKR